MGIQRGLPSLVIHFGHFFAPSLSVGEFGDVSTRIGLMVEVVISSVPKIAPNLLTFESMNRPGKVGDSNP